MGKPKISVIIPVYNVERYLEECLNSVVGQSLSDIEIICINDGSLDSSPHILSKYEIMDSRIHVITEENSGQSCARNRGISEAAGEYLVFLDGDDMLTAGALERIYQAIVMDDLDMVCYDAKLYYEEECLRLRENKDLYYIKGIDYPGVQSGSELLAQMIENDDFCDSVWALCIRKKMLIEKKITFYPGIYYEDCLFSIQCYIRASRVRYIKQQNYIYRIRANSTMTSKYTYRNLYSHLVCYQEIFIVLISEADSERRLQKALLKFSEEIRAKLIQMSLLLTKEDIQKVDNMLNGTQWLMEKAIGIDNITYNQKNYQVYLSGFEGELQKAKTIVLYGAGHVGKMVYFYLKDKHLESKVRCYAVSERIANGSCEKVPVVSIYELTGQDETLLLISTAKIDNQKDMCFLAQDMGFHNIIVVDVYLEGAIRKSLDWS